MPCVLQLQLSRPPACSHYLSVPPGTHLLSDMVLTSPILAGDRGIPEELLAEAGAGAGGAGAAAGGYEFGVDPSLDPELAMVRTMVCHHPG